MTEGPSLDHQFLFQTLHLQRERTIYINIIDILQVEALQNKIIYFSEYGDDNLQHIVDFFEKMLQSKDVVVDAVELEWLALKKDIYNR